MIELKDKKVLIMGNGPSVLQHEIGDEIDSFDVVIRLNSFIMQGFEKYCGTKTTIWGSGLGSGCTRHHLDYDFENIWALMPYRTLYEGAELKHERRVNSFFDGKFPRENIYLMGMSDFEKMIDPMPVGRPSTGLAAIFTAKEIFGATDITIHGFDYFKGAEGGKPTPHYYGDTHHRWKRLHHVDREMLWVYMLHEQGTIKFLRESNFDQETIDTGKKSFDEYRQKKNVKIVKDDRVKINIGPGDKWKTKYKKFSWKTLDCYFDADYNIDLRKKELWDIEDESVDIFYCSHVIEHLSDDQGQYMLNQCYTKLKEGGTLRIACPDLDKAFKAFEEDNMRFFKLRDVRTHGNLIEQRLVNWFSSYKTGGHKGTHGVHDVDPEEVRDNFKDMTKYEFVKWCVSLIPPEADYLAHVNGYWFDKLKPMLQEAGFEQIRRATWWDSEVEELREKRKTFDNRGKVSLYVECVK